MAGVLLGSFREFYELMHSDRVKGGTTRISSTFRWCPLCGKGVSVYTRHEHVRNIHWELVAAGKLVKVKRPNQNLVWYIRQDALLGQRKEPT